MQNVDLEFYFKKKHYSKGFFEMNYLHLCKDKNLINLIKGMLEMDYEKRITAKDALMHDFFKIN